METKDRAAAREWDEARPARDGGQADAERPKEATQVPNKMVPQAENKARKAPKE